MKQMKNIDGGGPRKPVGFLYSLACLYARSVLGRKYNLITDNAAAAGLKPPVLVLSNHESNYDFLICANTLRPLRLNFMVTTYFFHDLLLGRLLTLMGCIPKRQFLPDAGAIKAVMRTVARGGSVCIFPEGQVSYAGCANTIDPGIGKLAKKLGVTVVLHSVRGNYLTAPKWARGKKYKGRIESRAEVLFTPEQLATLSVDEINEGILRALDYDEFAWQRAARVPFEPERLTEGLETILYRCGECGKDQSMSARGHELVCDRCGYSVRFDEYGFFIDSMGKRARFDSISGWYRMQYECAEREYPEGFSYSAPCSAMRTVQGEFGYTPCGSGVITANDAGLHFEGEREGEPFALSALVERQSNVTHNATTHAIDIEGPDANYAFAPNDRRDMTKLLILYQIARSRWERRKAAKEL